MLHGYLDESYRDTPETAPIYVVAGYLADLASWVEFETRWDESMRRLGISHIGLHAADCERGVKEYADMEERKRREIVLQMVTDINASRLQGIITAIDNSALLKHGKDLKSFWTKPGKKYHRQHIYAMDLCAHSMFLATEESDEPISLVADRNEEFSGRCHEWYTARSRDLSSPFHHRYGGYAIGDRQKLVGLQAADLLAYSSLRTLTGDDGWYWPEMTSGIPLLRAVADDEFWQAVSAGFPRRDQSDDDGK